jgi:hypothetical protein
MSLSEKTKWWIPILVVGLLVGLLSFSRQVERYQKEIASLNEQNAALGKENERLRYINDLAVEFSVEPMIVTLVDHYSREYLAKNGPEWRLLKTPEFMTYIMLSLIYAESKGNPGAIGDGGRARGLTQIWVSTAKAYGEVTAEQLLDPETNISYSFQHFHHLLKKYKGNLALALYAWNRGAGTVDRLIVYGQSPQNGYGRKVYEAALLNNRQVVLKN